MIVYTGKQYGNEFNNGDEALFQDANRPRDNNKFKIKPGLQTEKQDFRQSNKDIKIKAAELMVEATRETSALSAYLISPLTQKYKEGDPGCIVNKDGNVEIVEDGTYIIQAFTQFIFPSTPNNGYQYSENVALLKFKNGGWVKQVATQGRVCANLGNSDQLGTTYSGWLNKGTIFTVGSSHTYGSVITLYQVMNIQRLA